MIDNSPTPPSITKKYLLRNNNLRTSLVAHSFLIFTILTGIAIAIMGYMFCLYNNILVSSTDEYKQTFYNSSIYLRNIDIGILLIYVICAIIFLFWMYRANNNMHALNIDKKFKFTPLKCIVSFFIPFLCLIWPVEAMEEMWKSTQKPSELSRKNPILAWFIVFLFYNIGSFHHTDKIINVRDTLVMGIIINMLGIIAALMMIKITWKINKNQNEMLR